VVDTYVIVGNNCVTVTNQALTAGGAGQAMQAAVVDPSGPRVVTTTPQTPAGARAVLNNKSTTGQDGVRKVDPYSLNKPKKDEENQ
jgi:hypothetical protein